MEQGDVQAAGLCYHALKRLAPNDPVTLRLREWLREHAGE